MITAKNNSKIKFVSGLISSTSKRREHGLFVLEGVRLCSELITESIEISEIFYTADAYLKNKELIDLLSKKAEFVSEVSSEVFTKISDTKTPQGIVAVAKTPQFSIKNSGNYIAFENIADPSNLGAAARTADALGFAGVILSKNGTDPFMPKVLRASMGAVLRLPIIVVDDFTAKITEFKGDGYTVTGTVVTKAQNINEVSFGGKEVVIIGNEANGLTEDIKKHCDRLVTIPMAGRAESLNAAAAAAIVMWEMSR